MAIEVNAYNVNSYCVLDHPGFLQTEVELDGAIAAATGSRGLAFEGFRLAERVRRVPRYSFQRGFSEVYRLKPSSRRWRRSAAASAHETMNAVAPSTGTSQSNRQKGVLIILAAK